MLPLKRLSIQFDIDQRHSLLHLLSNDLDHRQTTAVCNPLPETVPKTIYYGTTMQTKTPVQGLAIGNYDIN